MEHFLATWGYLALFGFNFLSAMGIPVGSEAAMGYAGALASGQLTTTGHDHLQLGLVIVVAILGDFVGSLAGYAIGRYGGRPLVDKVGKYILLTHRDLDRAEAWFARRGDPFVLIGRFIPLLRSWVSLAAGLGEMAIGKFLVFTIIGLAIYDAAICSIGYALGTSWHHVIKAFSYAGYVAGVLFVIAVVGLILHRVGVMRTERAAHSAEGLRARAEAEAKAGTAGEGPASAPGSRGTGERPTVDAGEMTGGDAPA